MPSSPQRAASRASSRAKAEGAALMPGISPGPKLVGHAEEQGGGLSGVAQTVGGFARRFAHAPSALRVKGDQIGAAAGRGADGLRDGIGNVVEFHVEKDMKAHVFQGGQYGRAAEREEFHARLDPGHNAAQARGHVQCGVLFGQIKSDDKLRRGRHAKSSSRARSICAWQCGARVAALYAARSRA